MIVFAPTTVNRTASILYFILLAI